MVLAKPEQGWKGWGHSVSEPEHAERDPGSMSHYLTGALEKLEMPRHSERATGKVTSLSWLGARRGWGRWQALSHGQEKLEPCWPADRGLLMSCSPHVVGASRKH